jgi:hypothetical protein
MPASVKAPRVWPPRPTASAAVFPHVHPRIQSRPLRRGAATRIIVKVVETYEYKQPVVFRIYDAHKKFLKSFKRKITTKFQRTFEDPKPRKAAWYVRPHFP